VSAREVCKCADLGVGFLFLSFFCSKLFIFLFTLGGNGRRYETLGISELRNYQPIRTLPASDALGIPLKPQCFMTAC